MKRLVAFLSAALIVGGLAAQAQAATYTVGTTADTTAGSACGTFPSGCSLRQLIEHENANTPSPPDSIVVPAGNYSLTHGVLLVTQSMTIAGAGARGTVVDQTSSTPDRVFDIQIPGSHVVPTVTISGLEITGGTANSSNGFFGGDVRNQGTLTLSEDCIRGGTTTGGSGAGISNDGGTLTVTHSLVSNNTSNSSGGGGDSGGIQNYGPNPVTGTAGALTVDNSTIADNVAALGGGIFSWNDSSNRTTVVDSTIANNDGGARIDQPNAGGLLSGSGGGSLSVENSIVAFNTVDSPTIGTASNCGPTGISSLGYNLETATDCGLKSTGDRQSTDPQFSSNDIQDNGGNTNTLAPKSSSLVVDHIPLGAPGCSGTDQRDISRPQGPSCDTGAVEILEPPEGQQFSMVVATAGCAVSGTPVINWGDGSSSSGTPPAAGQAGAITGTHTYAEEGTFTVTVNWTDDCGSQMSSFTIKVPDATLSSTPAAVTAQAGGSFTGPVATFTDADPAGTVSDYVASINWGDGGASTGMVVATGSGFAVHGTHTYRSSGSYAMTVSIADIGGASTTTSPTATVAPTVSGVSPSSGPLAGGNTVTISGSGFTGATAVNFGSTPATSFTVVSDTQITAAAPAGSATVDVTVTAPGGTSATSAADRYTYANAPAVTTGAPQVQSSSGAAFVGTVNADGLPTSAHFEYFLDSRYGTFPVLSTPDQQVGSDYSDHQVSASVMGLVPNALYHVRLVAANSAGTTRGPDQTFMTAKDPAPPPPVLGQSFDAGPVSGTVLFKLPGGPAGDRASDAADNGFIPLTEARQMPPGTQVDARTGTMKLIAALPQRHQTETGDFGGALFGLSQPRHGASRGVATLTLLEGAFPGAPGYTSCHGRTSHRVVQTLRASDRGRFRSRGGYASATVRGTIWITIDRCDGTLIIVKRGTVVVDDFVRRTTVTLHAGQQYLAKARKLP